MRRSASSARCGCRSPLPAFSSSVLCVQCALCVQAYNMLISGHAQAGDIQAASGMLEAMALRGLVPNRESYNTIISCLCRAGQAQQAQTVVAMAARRGIALDEWAWSAVVQVCAATPLPTFPILLLSRICLQADTACSSVSESHLRPMALQLCCTACESLKNCGCG